MDPGISKLTTSMSQQFEGELSIDEIHQTLISMKNNKSPGLDGYTVELFQTYLEKITNFCIEVFELCIDSIQNILYTEVGVISLIPKGNKKIKRPISLLSVFYNKVLLV